MHSLALRKELEHGSGGASARPGSTLSKLQKAAAKEAKANRDEYEMIKGQEVRYGMTINLRHEASAPSSRLLTV